MRVFLYRLQLNSGVVEVGGGAVGLSRVINPSESNLISGFCGRERIPTLSFLIPLSRPGGFMWVFQSAWKTLSLPQRRVK